MYEQYYDNYLKYKKQYRQMKRRTENTKDVNNFYLFHSIQFPVAKKIVSIINNGYLLFGKDLDIEWRGLTGYSAEDYIYTNIYFKDLKNFEFAWGGGGLIFSPKLLDEQDIYFNKLWQVTPGKDSIHIKKEDTKEERNKKLILIKKFLKNPKIKKKLLDLLPPMMYHEVLFDKPIPIKYLKAIICTSCKPTDIELIQQALDKKGLKIPVYTKNYPMPDV